MRESLAEALLRLVEERDQADDALIGALQLEKLGLLSPETVDVYVEEYTAAYAHYKQWVDIWTEQVHQTTADLLGI